MHVEQLTIEYSVYYAVQEPAVPSEDPPALLLALHGYGQSCKSFIRELAPFREQNVLVVAPQGPSQFYWQQGTPKVGFAWVTRFMRDNTLADIMGYMSRLLADLSEKYRFNHDKVFLLGFSNGAALAFRVAASGILKPAGVIACCGDLPENVAQKLDSLDPFPVLILHGKDDPMMSADKGREAEETLRRHGYPVEAVYFDGGHELPKGEWPTITDWMGRQLKGRG